MDSETVDHLKALIEFLNDETNWCQGNYTRWSTVYNKDVYCVAGAISAVLEDIYGDDEQEAISDRAFWLDRMLNNYIRRSGWDHIEQFNDATCYEAVMDFLNAVLKAELGKKKYPFKLFDKDTMQNG